MEGQVVFGSPPLLRFLSAPHDRASFRDRAVLTLLVSATIWAVAAHTGNPYTAQKARIGVFVALGTAALAGAGIAWANFLLTIGDRL